MHITANCPALGYYESPGSSPTAAVCHGGQFDGAHYGPCSALKTCQAEALVRVKKKHVDLTVAAATEGDRLVASDLVSLKNCLALKVLQPKHPKALPQYWVLLGRTEIKTSNARVLKGDGTTVIEPEQDMVYTGNESKDAIRLEDLIESLDSLRDEAQRLMQKQTQKQEAFRLSRDRDRERGPGKATVTETKDSAARRMLRELFAPVSTPTT